MSRNRYRRALDPCDTSILEVTPVDTPAERMVLIAVMAVGRDTVRPGYLKPSSVRPTVDSWKCHGRRGPTGRSS
jgi:hypothetical protein